MMSPCISRGSFSVGASIAQWQSVGLVNQRSWVQSSLEAVILTLKRRNWKKVFWPRRDSNTQPSDLESDALPLRHGVNTCQVLPRLELGSLDCSIRFKVQSANHYTIGPTDIACILKYNRFSHIIVILIYVYIYIFLGSIFRLTHGWICRLLLTQW